MTNFSLSKCLICGNTLIWISELKGYIPHETRCSKKNCPFYDFEEQTEDLSHVQKEERQ